MNTRADTSGLQPGRILGALKTLACAALLVVQPAHSDSLTAAAFDAQALGTLGTAGLTPKLAPASGPLALPPLREVWLTDATSALRACPQASALSELSLDNAMELALCNSPKLKNAWLDIQIQVSSIGEAQAGYYPNASYSVSRSGQRTRTPEGDGIFSPAGGVEKVSSKSEYGAINWRLFDFGERSGTRSAATHQHAAALLNYETTLQELRRNLIATYFEASVARWSWLTRQGAESLSLKLLRVVKRRQLNGSASLADLARASTSYANSALERSRAKTAYDRALLNLAQTMGLQGHSDLGGASLQDADVCFLGLSTSSTSDPCVQGLLSYLDQTDDAAQFVMAVTHNSGRIIQHLRDSHPALASLRAQASSSRAKAVSLKGQLLPKLDFVANYYKNGSLTQGLVNNDATRVVAGLSVTVPLFDGFATQSKMKGVLHQAEKSEAELQGIEAQLLNDWSMLQSELINALANLQASARLQDVAEIALDSYQRRLARGEADSIELMSAQAQFLNARQERHRAVSEWHSAKLRLLLLSGGQGSIQVVGDPGAGLTKGP